MWLDHQVPAFVFWKSDSYTVDHDFIPNLHPMQTPLLTDFLVCMLTFCNLDTSEVVSKNYQKMDVIWGIFRGDTLGIFRCKDRRKGMAQNNSAFKRIDSLKENYHKLPS